MIVVPHNKSHTGERVKRSNGFGGLVIYFWILPREVQWSVIGHEYLKSPVSSVWS